MDKLYYSIGETADILGENVSAVRFWSNSFERFVKPRRNAKGNRLFTAGDIETLKQIKFLVKSCGMTLDGASRKLIEDRKSVEDRVKVVETLKQIRKELLAVKAAL
ncbi:MAG: MerR family transcriptional regulator [Bacteroidales bacterium]|nr:MerR family transcriptional regulator [Bacteroidales bacterium]